MGGCVGTSRTGAGGSGEANGSGGQSVSIGRNQPLKQDKPRWKSDVPLTEGQLRSKRDEFWDTAPAFEGRKEIWDALKAAAYAQETEDYALAQAIIDGAGISLPHGTLMDCYDELGNRYQLPVYVLSSPNNQIEESSEAESEGESVSDDGPTVPIKFRLSTGKDLKLDICLRDTVAKVKRRLATEEGIDANKQRWFFSGRLLSDKLRIEDCKIPKGFVVQVILTQETPTPVGS